MMRDFDQLLTQLHNELKARQEAFMIGYNIEQYDSWYYDQPSGVFTFSSAETEAYFLFQCIGSYSPKAKSWLWSWANTNTYPNVKTDSIRIKDYGVINGYEKLVTESWPAEEVDGWEMLSVALHVLNPIGVYRIPTDGIYLFMVFTEAISNEEAEERKNQSKKWISCDCHGLGRVAFVCRHLDKEHNRGFNESFETWKGMDLGEDDDFQAWCDECENVRIKYDGWNDESMKVADIKLVCEGCYFEMKAANTK